MAWTDNTIHQICLSSDEFDAVFKKVQEDYLSDPDNFLDQLHDAGFSKYFTNKFEQVYEELFG